jgi:hypothetical protein
MHGVAYLGVCTLILPLGLDFNNAYEEEHADYAGFVR